MTVTEFFHYAAALWTLHCRIRCLVGSAQRNGKYFLFFLPRGYRSNHGSKSDRAARWEIDEKERKKGMRCDERKPHGKGERNLKVYKSSGDPASRQAIAREVTGSLSYRTPEKKNIYRNVDRLRSCLLGNWFISPDRSDRAVKRQNFAAARIFAWAEIATAGGRVRDPFRRISIL